MLAGGPCGDHERFPREVVMRVSFTRPASRAALCLLFPAPRRPRTRRTSRPSCPLQGAHASAAACTRGNGPGNIRSRTRRAARPTAHRHGRPRLHRPRVQIVGVSPSPRRFTIVGGLTPNPNVAAQAVTWILRVRRRRGRGVAGQERTAAGISGEECPAGQWSVSGLTGPDRKKGGYSGETDVRPQSSHRRYRTGSASERPMTRALGTPQRGQTIPEVERLAIGLLLTPLFRLPMRIKRYTNT